MKNVAFLFWKKKKNAASKKYAGGDDQLVFFLLGLIYCVLKKVFLFMQLRICTVYFALVL